MTSLRDPVRTEIVVALIILAQGAVLDVDAVPGALPGFPGRLQGSPPGPLRGLRGASPYHHRKIHRMRLQELFVPNEAVSA